MNTCEPCGSQRDARKTPEERAFAILDWVKRQSCGYSGEHTVPNEEYYFTRDALKLIIVRIASAEWCVDTLRAQLATVDTRKIAAAPTMLEALQCIANWNLDARPGHADHMSREYVKLVAARIVAEATGND